MILRTQNYFLVAIENLSIIISTPSLPLLSFLCWQIVALVFNTIKELA